MSAEKSGREKRQHATLLKPFSYYRSAIPEYFPQVPLHWHREFEINYIIEGCAAFVCGSEGFTARSGDIVVIAPDMLHAVYPVGRDRCVYDTLVFGGSMIGASDGDRAAFSIILPLINGSASVCAHITGECPPLKAAAENIMLAAKCDTPQHDILMKSELMRFFWLLCDSGGISSDRQQQSAGAELILPALEYMNECYSECIDIKTLAEKAHLSRSYFMSLFKRITGVGAMEYVNQLRLKAARELLCNTEMAVCDIAFECGFKNLSNFNRQFKASSLCSPTEYRRKRRSLSEQERRLDE